MGKYRPCSDTKKDVGVFTEMKFLGLFQHHKSRVGFDSISGYDDIKRVIGRALESVENFNLLLVGRPASCKTQFLMEIMKVNKDAEYFDTSFIFMNKASDALVILNELMSEGHTVPWILDDRGVVLLGLKNYAGAIANFNATLKAEPMDAYALFNRAEAFLNMDLDRQKALQQLEQHKQLIFPHLDIALQDLNKVLSIDPYDKDAKSLKSLSIQGLELGFLKR